MSARAPKGSLGAKFLLRLPPEMHRALSEASADDGLSMNEWVRRAIDRTLDTLPMDKRETKLLAEIYADVNGIRPLRSITPSQAMSLLVRLLDRVLTPL